MFYEVKEGRLGSETATMFCDDMYATLINLIRQSCPFINDRWRSAEQLRQGDSSENLTWPDNLYGYGEYSRPSRHLLVEQLVKILDFCEKHKLNAAVGRMLNLFEDTAKTGNEVAFGKYLLPGLKFLPPPEVQVEDARYQRVFSCVITSYTTQYLGKPPEKPKDWSRPKAGCNGKKLSTYNVEKSDCQDCRDLDSFLVDPAQPIMHFRAVEDCRKHLERKLPYGEYDTYTDRSQGKPLVLVIRKTDKGWQKSRDEWDRKRTRVEDEIKELGEYKIVAMLGDQCNEILASAGFSIATSTHESATNRQPLGEVPSAAVNVQGGKRTREEESDIDAERWKRPRTEIIDLEDDD